MNTGYLTAKRTKQSDEQYTPIYAVEPLVKYIPKGVKIWLPFDKKWSAYNQVFKEHGFETTCTHIDYGQDFYNFEPKEWDMIVSNPPYSQKDEVLKRVYELGKPFCLLLPLATLQGKERFKYFKNGLQILSFDSRISFHNQNSMQRTIKGTPFACAYFIGGRLLPKDLMLEELKVYEKPLVEEAYENMHNKCKQ